MKRAHRSLLSAVVLIAGVSGSSWPVLAGPNGESFESRLKGAYAGAYQGFLLLGGTAFDHNGIEQIRFDGSGGLTGSETLNILFPGPQGGQLTCQGSLSGTYQIDGDGTGTLALTFTPSAGQNPNCEGASSTASLVISDRNRFVDIVSTEDLAPQTAIHIHVQLRKQ